MIRYENHQKKKELWNQIKDSFKARLLNDEKLPKGLRYGSRNHNLAFEQHHG